MSCVCIITCIFSLSWVVVMLLLMPLVWSDSSFPSLPHILASSFWPFLDQGEASWKSWWCLFVVVAEFPFPCLLHVLMLPSLLLSRHRLSTYLTACHIRWPLSFLVWMMSQITFTWNEWSSSCQKRQDSCVCPHPSPFPLSCLCTTHLSSSFLSLSKIIIFLPFFA